MIKFVGIFVMKLKTIFDRFFNKNFGRKKLINFSERSWYFAVKPCEHPDLPNYLAWCSQQPLVADHPLREPEDREIYFEFGRTKEEAIARLKAEVL